MVVFSDKIKSDLKEEAIIIGEKLIARAFRDEDGIYWKTLSIKAESRAGAYPYIRKVNENIYAGSSGIILFLTELYLHTGDEKYKQAILDACHWLIGYVDRTASDNYAFITGRTGVAYVVNRVGRLFALPSYVEWSLSLARRAISFIRTEAAIEYLNGISGTAWGLLLLYEHNREAWILSYLQEAVERIAKDIRVYKEGFYWDRSENQIRGLCGISHGSAGVAGFLCELGYFFDSAGFLSMAASALQYENYFFDRHTGQWPDFRKNGYDDAGRQKSEDRYRVKDLDFFEHARQMSAWCHGNIGIGFVHNRLLQLQGETARGKIFPRPEQAMLKRSMEMHVGRGLELGNAGIISYNLCHGVCGNMDLFLHVPGSPGTSRKEGEAYLHRVVAGLLYDRDKSKPLLSGYLNTDEEDDSLFAGIAGTGYFALRCLDPVVTPSILYPALSTRDDRGGTLQCPDVLRIVSEKYFPHTVAALKKHVVIEDLLPLAGRIKNISRVLGRVVRGLPGGPAKRECGDWLRYERSRIEWDLSSNNHYLFIESTFHRKQAARMIAGIDNYSFVLATQVRLHKIRSVNGDVFLASFRGGDGVGERRIQAWMYLLLNIFRTPKRIDTAVEELSVSFADLRENRQAIFTNVMKQVREAISGGLLVGVGVEPEPDLHFTKQQAVIL